MDVKIGAPGKGCFPAKHVGKDGWGSLSSPALSAVESFRVVLAVWKWWCLKWSKHLCRQAPGAFTRCHGSMSTSGPHALAIKSYLLCCWAPAEGCCSGNFQWKKSAQILAVCWGEHRPLRCWSCCQEFVPACLKGQPQCKCAFRSVRPKEPCRRFQI